jgi:hypothetical protein
MTTAVGAVLGLAACQPSTRHAAAHTPDAVGATSSEAPTAASDPSGDASGPSSVPTDGPSLCSQLSAVQLASLLGETSSGLIGENYNSTPEEFQRDCSVEFNGQDPPLAVVVRQGTTAGMSHTYTSLRGEYLSPGVPPHPGGSYWGRDLQGLGDEAYLSGTSDSMTVGVRLKGLFVTGTIPFMSSEGGMEAIGRELLAEVTRS